MHKILKFNVFWISVLCNLYHDTKMLWGKCKCDNTYAKGQNASCFDNNVITFPITYEVVRYISCRKKVPQKKKKKKGCSCISFSFMAKITCFNTLGGSEKDLAAMIVTRTQKLNRLLPKTIRILETHFPFPSPMLVFYCCKLGSNHTFFSSLLFHYWLHG